MTSYQVLQEQGMEGKPPGSRWDAVGRVDAHNDQHAIKLATADRDPDKRSGTFVAIPVRSFRPRARKVETFQRDLWA
jgi:hypothetical protein